MTEREKLIRSTKLTLIGIVLMIIFNLVLTLGILHMAFFYDN